jgi:glyoxylate/hydroxypyruvate reductase A
MVKGNFAAWRRLREPSFRHLVIGGAGGAVFIAGRDGVRAEAGFGRRRGSVRGGVRFEARFSPRRGSGQVRVAFGLRSLTRDNWRDRKIALNIQALKPAARSFKTNPPSMKIILYEHPAEAHLWLQDLSRALPEADVRLWQPRDTAPADYAVVWRPPPEVFANRPDMKAVFNLGAGVDAILAIERKQPGTLPPNALLVRLEDSGMALQMVEYATWAVLRYLRRMDEYDAIQREHRWQRLTSHARETFTVAVLGMGVLGTRVAQALIAFGLPVRGFSRTKRHVEGVQTFAGAEQFDAFLDGANVLINLLPHTPDTEGILNQRTFERLASGAYVINLARGGHLVDDDLLRAMQSGQIAAATLDVFHKEPLPDNHPFWSTPRITITPHISAVTPRRESIEQIAGKIRTLVRGEPISGIVDVKRGY